MQALFIFDGLAVGYQQPVPASSSDANRGSRCAEVSARPSFGTTWLAGLPVYCDGY
jgi:hypothetical protein